MITEQRWSITAESDGNPSDRPALRSGLRPPALDSIVGRCLGGKLIVEERIGKGRLGAVYRAKHVLLPHPIAVKVLHPHYEDAPEFRARFLAEAQTASVLDHPCLVRIIDFGEQWGGAMWLAMELLEGVPLDALLAKEGRLPVERAVAIVLDVCAGLAHAHARGILHGDVKPSNVVLVARTNDDGDVIERAKLRDFGATLGRCDAGRADADESGSRRVIAAPAYMSPEQCLGEELDARTDVYACGVLLYELVTGRAPFVGSEPQSLQRQHLLIASVPPAARRTNVDLRIDAIVAKALAKDRDKRFGSIRELRVALRELAVDLGQTTAVFSSFPPPRHEDQAVEHARTSELRPPRSQLQARASESREPRPGNDELDMEDFLRARAELADREKHALGELLLRGSVDAVAWRVAQLLTRVESSSGRDSVATETLRVLDAPASLASFAERLLAHDARSPTDVARVLGRGGAGSARALWAARISPSGAEPAHRARFVSWMRALGPAAREVLGAALVKLAPHAETTTFVTVIEDVLFSLPERCDDELLDLALAFAKSPSRRVRELTLATLERTIEGRFGHRFS
jgi:serine/threonine-protein kinase